MKQSGAETDTESYCLIEDQDGGQQEVFMTESVRSRPGVVSRLIVSCGDPGLARDYLVSLDDKTEPQPRAAAVQCVTPETFIAATSQRQIYSDEVVVFLDRHITGRTLSVFAGLRQLASASPFTCLLVVPSLLNHLSPDRIDEIQQILNQLRESICASGVLIILRTGFVLSASSSIARRIDGLRGFRRLLLPQLTTTFVDGAKLFLVINEELDRVQTEKASGSSTAKASARQLTLLGTRRSWRSVFSDSASSGIRSKSGSVAVTLLVCAGVPWLLYWGVRLLSLVVPSVRQLQFETLRPRSVHEMISLYNRHNCGDVQLAGYNNGVNHFGWKFPEKTVVQTTRLPGKTQLSDVSILDLETRIRNLGIAAAAEEDSNAPATPGGTHFTVDAGLTLNHCIRELNKFNREFYVVPNYSWISMGTLYFVPVHGSGSHVSTLGDTIEDVLFYDGDDEQFILTRRGDAMFRDSMYNTSRHRLLLRLTLRVKPKSAYFVRQETMESPSAEDIQRVLDDIEASHVEIRKNRASSPSIDVFRYYVDSAADGVGTLEIPRDSIGRVWDRLEETPIVSNLFHWFVRTFAFHVELFLKSDEFVVFWKHHQTLPISKIQLRRVLRDGITHSACANENCISADLFMTRSNRDVFLRFVATHLPNVRSNPGKQSL